MNHQELRFRGIKLKDLEAGAHEKKSRCGFVALVHESRNREFKSGAIRKSSHGQNRATSFEETSALGFNRH